MSTENEIAAEVEDLKSQFSDTKTLYREVCVLLFFRHGITPTASKLYQFVRRGSMSAPAEALAKFWDDLRSKARVEIDHPDMPDEVKALAAEAIAGLWRQATEHARNELAAIRLDLEADRERQLQALGHAEQAASAAQARNQQLEEAVRDAQEAVAAANAALEAERRTHTGTVARLQEARGQLEQARDQQQRLQEGFSADLATARSAIEAA